MRTVLSFFLSTLLWATTCAYAQTDEVPYQIDEQATAKAPWKVGEVIAQDAQADGYYRKFIGVTNKGYFVVQDFYKKTQQKVIDPLVITQQGVVLDMDKPFITYPLDSMLVSWSESGGETFEGRFENGRPQGILTWWYENGQKQSKGQYQDGQMQGLWNSWHDNGQKMLEGQYQNGKNQGLWTEWNEEGKKISETIYENGKEVSKKTFD